MRELSPCPCRFEEACAAFADGGRPDLGRALLQQLADNAVAQCRFADAAHNYYKLAMESLKVCTPYERTMHTCCICLVLKLLQLLFVC